MLVSIHSVGLENTIFFILLALAIFLSRSRRNDRAEFLPMSVTNELKGFAILAVIFAHVGLYLVDNTQFLVPLSYFAGVGVNIFLFLSGFGLTVSALKKHLSVERFYLKRLSKIFIPMWLVLGLLIFLDFFIHHQSYNLTVLWHAFVGFFPEADLYNNINSPLWYISLTLFYYILFPLLFSKKAPYLSAVTLFGISYWLVYKNHLPSAVTLGVLSLYKLHLFAFPLGMIGGWFAIKYAPFIQVFLTKPFWLRIPRVFLTSLRWLVLVCLVVVVYYFAIHSGVGKGIRTEEKIGLITTFGVIAIFILKSTGYKMLQILGLYSYEIYLLHWPLVYRFDFIYKIFSPAVATFIYLFIFIALAFGLRRISEMCEKQIGLSKLTT